MSLQVVESMEQLESEIDSGENVMVVFSKDQCPACNTMGQWLDKSFVPQEDNSKIRVIVAKLEQVGRKVVEDFGLRSMPTTLLFRRGDEVYRIPGFTGPAPLENAINMHLKLA